MKVLWPNIQQYVVCFYMVIIIFFNLINVILLMDWMLRPTNLNLCYHQGIYEVEVMMEDLQFCKFFNFHLSISDTKEPWSFYTEMDTRLFFLAMYAIGNTWVLICAEEMPISSNIILGIVTS